MFSNFMIVDSTTEGGSYEILSTTTAPPTVSRRDLTLSGKKHEKLGMIFDYVYW